MPPDDDRTFIHIDSFDAGVMKDNQPKEADALREIADVGYRSQDLPDGITIAPAEALPVPGLRCRPHSALLATVVDGRDRTPHVSAGTSTDTDPL